MRPLVATSRVVVMGAAIEGRTVLESGRYFRGAYDHYAQELWGAAGHSILRVGDHIIF